MFIFDPAMLEKLELPLLPNSRTHVGLERLVAALQQMSRDGKETLPLVCWLAKAASTGFGHFA